MGNVMKVNLGEEVEAPLNTVRLIDSQPRDLVLVSDEVYSVTLHWNKTLGLFLCQESLCCEVEGNPGLYYILLVQEVDTGDVKTLLLYKDTYALLVDNGVKVGSIFRILRQSREFDIMVIGEADELPNAKFSLQEILRATVKNYPSDFLNKFYSKMESDLEMV